MSVNHRPLTYFYRWCCHNTCSDIVQCDQKLKSKVTQTFPKVAQKVTTEVYTWKWMFSKQPKKSIYIWATFVRKFVTQSGHTTLANATKRFWGGFSFTCARKIIRHHLYILKTIGHPSFSFIFDPFKHQHNFLANKLWKRSIYYLVLEFKLTTSWIWGSSHNHLTRAPPAHVTSFVWPS